MYPKALGTMQKQIYINNREYETISYGENHIKNDMHYVFGVMGIIAIHCR